MLFDPAFWISVLQIIAIDILLGGDNAIVIAMACRNLPEQQRNRAITWGVVGAIVLRLAMIALALQLLQIPFLKIGGGLLLVWIGIKLQQDGDEVHDVKQSAGLLAAVWTIIVADAVMSIDNVVAVSAAARGELLLVVFGIVVSIPIILWGSRIVMLLMTRFPIVVTAGAAMLGWIGGSMVVGDIALQMWLGDMPHWLNYVAGALGALAVVAAGRLLAKADDDAAK